MARIFLLTLLAAAVAVMAVGCGGRQAEPDVEATATETAATVQSPSPTAEPVPSPTPATPAETSPSPTPTPVSDGSPVPTATPEEFVYDSNRNMFLLLSGLGHPPEYTLAALLRAVEAGDASQVPVILELMQFFGSDLAEYGVGAVVALTGENFGLDLRSWREWLGPRLDEYAPPSDYARWKSDFLRLIDPDMGALMESAIEGGSRANLVEIVWGGVGVDGIPPLEYPLHVEPEEAEYLEPDDRVFGVSINGEHRAYPLRILNAHELANDELGGEPISLVY